MDENHDETEPVGPQPLATEDGWEAATTRKNFLKGAAVAGATGLSVLAPAAALARGRHGKHGMHDRHHRHHKPAMPSGPTKTDLEILGAAQIAEALAITTYTNIINTSPFFKNIPDDDQGYLEAAVQEEMSHYLLEESVTGKPAAFTTFYYAPKMFSDAQTTLDILVTLEDAFITAYLVGVREFSTPRPEGHGGPDHGHRVRPPHAGARGRAGCRVAVRRKGRAEKAGFDATKPYAFTPFKPTLPIALGEFHSFAG